MDRRDFLASALAAPFLAQPRPMLPAKYLSVYCFWIGELYCCAKEEGGYWELNFSYYRENDERSSAFPSDLREALLNAGFGSRYSEQHHQTLVFHSTLTPDEVIRRCENVMAMASHQ